MSFSQTLWSNNNRLIAAISAMPFNTQLRDGILRPEPFRHYIVQDAHYLEGFARALALTAAKADTAEQVAMLSSAAAGAIHVERQLHETYFKAFGVSAAEFSASTPTPVCDHYVSYLIRIAAVESFAVAVAALLPCFWIYMDVGKGISARSVAENPYKAWIDTYAGEEFELAVHRMITLTDALAASASEATRLAMRKAFRHSTMLEWLFWDSAHNERGWHSAFD